MNNIKVTNEIRMEVVKYFGYAYEEDLKNYYMNEAPEDLIKFYYNCMKNNIDSCDADRYADLNTVFGYDVGLENFLQIDRYLWNEKDYDLMELYGNEDGKELIKETADVCGIEIDFSNWHDGEIEEYKYFV